MISWNPWHGCRRLSEGCDNCYMHYLDAKFGRDGGKITRSSSNFRLPLARRRDGGFKIAPGEVVYVCLASDFFLEEADGWRNDAWDVISARRDLTFVIITKRALRIAECLPPGADRIPENVRLNVTVENQRRADERLPAFLELPASFRGISVTPMLEALKLERYLATGGISEVTVGGENYDGARVCRFEWVAELREQCRRCGVRMSFFDTGALFERGGRLYHVPFKLRHEQAKKSGLSYNPEDDRA